MSLFERKAGLVAAAAIAASVAATPLSAHEQSFSALESLGAQPLSAAEMDAVNGRAYTFAVSALLAYAAQIQATQPVVSTQYTTIANSLSTVTTTTTRTYIRTSTSLVFVRR